MPPKQESGTNTASQNSPSNPKASTDSPPPTNYRIVKDGWGDRPNFQLSFGLRMTPEDIEEGNRILDGFREDIMEERDEAKKNSSWGGGGAAGKAEWEK
ncbi:hypothetical protein VE03_07955 [Pseudogymnoascus sp. 23342-1-I1]|nr:hypothetical protein VE03_07955 [Pseudogymnoascus sp. 23342-1-I1]